MRKWASVLVFILFITVERSFRLRSKNYTPPPPVATGLDGGAAMLNISRDHFERHVAPALRVIRSGRRKLYLVRDIERWAEQSAARTLDG
jgi:hypothetical protein